MKTVDKAMDLLRQFAPERLEIGLNDLAKLTGQDKAVTRRLLMSLAKHGFVEQNPENRKYHLGPGFLYLARLREATVPIGKAAQAVADWLSANTNETVHVGIAGDNGMTTIAYRLPTRGNVINLRPGEVYPFHASSSGLAYLSFCSPQTRDRILGLKREKLTRFTPTKLVDLRSSIEMIRSAGYAYSRNTVEVGVASVAMPFFAGTEDPTGTISIAVPDLNLTEERKAELLESLKAAVRRIEATLSGETLLGDSKETR